MFRPSYVLAAFTLLALTCAGLAAPAAAQPAGAQEEDSSPHSEARLVSAAQSIQPGTPFTVALRIQMEDGWHSYWKNPGDSGQPTSIEWDLPQGFTASAIQWPHPHRIEAGPLTSYGYSQEVLLLVQITPPEGLSVDSTVTLAGQANWLICADICLPAETNLRRSLPVRASPPAASRWQQPIKAARAKLPRSLADWDVRATQSEGSYALQITPPPGQTLPTGTYFYPDEKAVLDHAAPQPLSKKQGTYVLAMQQSEYAQEPAKRLQGVLVAPEGHSWGAQSGAQALSIDAPIEDAAQVGPAAGASADGGMTLLWALLLAFGGGLILNLMPCVFPILSVKILGFARQAHAEKSEIRKHGLTFGAGVLASFWILAGLLLAFRAAGSQVGWGFQLQSPAFIAVMALLFFGIGLNLMGVFEVGTTLMNWGGRMEQAVERTSYSGSLFSGVLATIVATPCTAPFMGAALGYAVTIPVTKSLLIFTALGAGMAAPYVAFSFAPSLLQRLPKPGRWMETFKQVLAFPMFATTIWLVWVFGQQTGTNGTALLLFSLLLMSLAGWLLKRWNPHRISTRQRLLTRGLALAALLGALATGWIGAGYQPPESPTPVAQQESAWQSFSSEKVAQLRAKGQPVFVDFTAAWCLTCQVNKRTTLNTASVQQAFRKRNVALIKADWTNHDPEITRALEAQGRSGVPLYLLYKGDGSEPLLLPEVLTPDIVLGALDKLPDQSSNNVAARGN